MAKAHRISLIAAALFTAGADGGVALHVDDDAQPGGDGSSWSGALKHLQDALAIARDAGGGVSEIRLAQGVYRPDRSARAPDGDGDRAARFQLVGGVAVRGGYLGLGASKGQDPDERNIKAYASILDGDLNGDDGPPGSFVNTLENSLQIVTAIDVSGAAALDGVVVRGARADGRNLGPTPESRDRGGAVNIFNASPTLIDCTFEDNWMLTCGAVNDEGDTTTLIRCTFRGNHAEGFAGGLYCGGGASTFADFCIFVENTTRGDGGGTFAATGSAPVFHVGDWLDNQAARGGGVYNAPASHPQFLDCLMCFNEAVDGGGMYNDSCEVTFEREILLGNIASARGGGIYSLNSLAAVIDVSLTTNEAGDGGGAIFCEGGAITMGGCVFNFNEADQGGAVRGLDAAIAMANCTLNANTASNGAAVAMEGGTLDLRASQINNNMALTNAGGVWLSSGAAASISTSSFRNGTAALGAGGGIMLGSAASVTILDCLFKGHYAVEGAGLFVDQRAGEAAIGQTHFCENAPDHISGAFEDLGGNLVGDHCCPADANNSGAVNHQDLNFVLNYWGPCLAGACAQADANNDGEVDVLDLLLVINTWGPCP